MIVTVEEAKTKRCQESFGDTNVSPSGHSYAANISYGISAVVQTSPSYCIGPACMAWKWYGEHTIDGNLLGSCGKAGLP